jgi:hypothetical protein
MKINCKLYKHKNENEEPDFNTDIIKTSSKNSPYYLIYKNNEDKCEVARGQNWDNEKIITMGYIKASDIDFNEGSYDGYDVINAKKFTNLITNKSIECLDNVYSEVCTLKYYIKNGQKTLAIATDDNGFDNQKLLKCKDSEEKISRNLLKSSDDQTIQGLHLEYEGTRFYVFGSDYENSDCIIVEDYLDFKVYFKYDIGTNKFINQYVGTDYDNFNSFFDKFDITKETDGIKIVYKLKTEAQVKRDINIYLTTYNTGTGTCLQAPLTNCYNLIGTTVYCELDIQDDVDANGGNVTVTYWEEVNNTISENVFLNGSDSPTWIELGLTDTTPDNKKKRIAEILPNRTSESRSFSFIVTSTTDSRKTAIVTLTQKAAE